VFYQLLGGSRVWILVIFNSGKFSEFGISHGNSIAFQIISVFQKDPLKTLKTLKMIA